MTTCTQLSDRMPEVALGRARWTAGDEEHLAGCTDCRAEWAIVLAASRLGASLPVADPARTASRALERLREARARSRSRARLAMIAGLAAAAVVALAVWAGRGGRGAAPGERTVPAPAPVATTPTVPAPTAPAADTQAQHPPEPRLAQGPAARAAVEIPLPELDSLPAEVLDSMLQALDEPLAHVGAYDLPPDESGDRELERALAGLEG